MQVNLSVEELDLIDIMADAYSECVQAGIDADLGNPSKRDLLVGMERRRNAIIRLRAKIAFHLSTMPIGEALEAA